MRLVSGRRFALVVLLFLVACSGSNTPTPGNCSPDPAIVRIGSSQLTVRVAEDEASREQGLMGVTSLPAGEGMAFVFGGPTTGSFWMKDTLIPLSIAFVGADGRIVTLREMTPVRVRPMHDVRGDAPYVTAIEANAGWFADAPYRGR